MIMIEYKGSQASWSSKSQKWVSTDKQFENILNRNLPDDDDITASMPFRIGGLDKIVLDKIKAVFGRTLNVIAFLPSPAPEEIDGVLY